MAIYHLNANVISRARGQSIVAAAAYRAGARLRDERYGVVHNYVGRRTCAHAEIMAPDDTPAWVHDREQLWNRVEAAELRKDSQLARVIEVGLPVELDEAQGVALVRDYVATVFVARGMIADFCIRRDNPDNPHAHILLTLRGMTPQGFGPKERRWNGKANLLEWRAAWAERANRHLADAGFAVRIDHRTLEAQQLELTPARRMGIGRATDIDLPDHLAGRIVEQRQIARSNGDAILEDPTVALRALTHRSASFDGADLERFLRSRTADAVQFVACLEAVLRSPDLVTLPAAGGGSDRFTSRDMIEAAKSLRHRVTSMRGRRTHAVTAHNRAAIPATFALPDAVARAFEYLVDEGAVKALALADDSGPRLLDAVVAALLADGLTAVRVTPQTSDGMESLNADGVLVVEAAEMMSLKQLERVIAAADRARAKVILLGDASRLDAMGDDTPFAGVLQITGEHAR